MSFFARILLVCTSLSPMFLVVGVQQFEQKASWICWGSWILVAVLLICMCGGLLRYMSRRAQRHLFLIEGFERRDQEMLTYLFIYLLPFIRSSGLSLSSGWLTTSFVLAVIVLALALTGAFHFNPVMRLVLRYRFYSVRSNNGVSYLLISRQDLLRPGQEIQTVSLTQDVRLHIGDVNA